MQEAKERSPVPPGRYALSPSKINCLACPYRYREVYITGTDLETDDRKPAVFAIGNLVHDVAAKYFIELRQLGAESSPLTLGQLTREVWAARPTHISDNHWSEFESLCSPLQFRIYDPTTIYDVELRMSFDEDWNEVPWDSENVAWGGIADLVCVTGAGKDARAIITDWTTGGLGARIQAQKDLQVRHYGLLVNRKYGISKVQVIVDSVRTGASVKVDLDQGDHEETLFRLKTERDRLIASNEDDDNQWPALPGHLCEYCTLDCPRAEEAVAAGSPIRLHNIENAQLVLGRAVLLDRQLKDLKRVLKFYVNQHGPVTANGMVAEVRLQDLRNWDVLALLPQLEEFGVEPNVVLNADSTKLKSAMKRHKDILESWHEQFCAITKGERFGVFKEKA